MMKTSARTLALATRSMARRDGVDAAVKTLVDACTNMKLTHMLPSVLRRLKFLVAQDARVETLSITLAREPHGEILEKIRTYVGAPAEARIEVQIDPTVVGGFLATFGGVSYDGRIKRHIDNLRI